MVARKRIQTVPSLQRAQTAFFSDHFPAADHPPKPSGEVTTQHEEGGRCARLGVDQLRAWGSVLLLSLPFWPSASLNPPWLLLFHRPHLSTLVFSHRLAPGAPPSPRLLPFFACPPQSASPPLPPLAAPPAAMSNARRDGYAAQSSFNRTQLAVT